MENKSTKKNSIFDNPVLSTKIKSANVKFKEMLFGYFFQGQGRRGEVAGD